MYNNNNVVDLKFAKGVDFVDSHHKSYHDEEVLVRISLTEISFHNTYSIMF